MRRVLGGLIVLVAVAGGLLLLGGDDEADPDSPEALERALDGEGSLVGELPGYVPPPPRAEPETPAPPAEPTPKLEGRKDAFLFVRVVDPEGAPVPLAWVHVEVGKGEDWREHVEETKAGVAKIPAPTPDERMHVAVSEPRDAEGRPLNLLERRIEDLAVDAAEVVVALEPARALCGRVFDEDGAPVGGIRVLAAHAKRLSTGREAVTDASGRFEVRALPAGPLEVRVRRGDPWLPLSHVELGASDDEVELVLHRKRDLVVRLVTADEEPVENARIEVDWAWAGQAWNAGGRTDAEGRFVVTGACSSATYAIRVRAGEAKPAVPDAWVTDREYGEGLVRIEAPASVEIRGRLVDEEGAPVASGWVRARGLEAHNHTLAGWATVRGGAFAMGRLAPGRYRLEIGPGWDRMAKPPKPLGQPKPIEVVAPADLRLVIPPAVSAVGTIVGGTSGDARVVWYIGGSLSRENGVFRNGRFRLDHLADEPGSLYAVDPSTGGCALLENVRPSDGPFELELKPGGVIAGRIENYRKRKWSVRIHLTRGPIRFTANLDRDRRFNFQRLPPGPWRVELARYDGTVFDAVDGVGPGAEDVVLRMPP